MLWKNPSFVSSIAFATLASGLLDFKMHWRVLKDVHHMAWLEPVLGSLLPGTSSLQKYAPRASCGQPITRHL
ncbi:hypothetical protein V6N13_088838 [Hibiscus sabdariffa]